MDQEGKATSASNVTRLPGASRRPSSTSQQSSLKEATEAAANLLALYPDYGTASPEYCAGIISVLRTYPASIFPSLTNLRTGIPATCKTLPTIAHIVEAADRLLNEAASLAQIPPRVAVEAGTPAWEAWSRRRGRPFPTTDIRMDDGRMVKGWYFPAEFPSSQEAAS